jgi:hypothetical protein
VRIDPSYPEPMVDPLLGFCLSRAFSLHTWDPLTHPELEALNMLLRPKTPKHDPRDFDTPHAG